MANSVLANLVIRVGANTSNAVKGMRKLRGSIQKATARVKRFGKALFNVQRNLKALAGVAGVGFAVKKLFDLGAAVEETASKFNEVFGPATESVQGFVDEFANMAGLTSEAAQEILATTGSIVQGMGFARTASAEFSQEVVRLAGDFASFNNIPIAETSLAIQSALTGERESLKRLGVVILETDVQRKALLQTNKESAKQLTQQEKATATLALISERAGVAVGNLAKTQNSNANTARRMAAELGDIRDTLGAGLIPAFSVMLGTVNDNSSAFDTLKVAAANFGGVVATLITAVGVFGATLPVMIAQLKVADLTFRNLDQTLSDKLRAPFKGFSEGLSDVALRILGLKDSVVPAQFAVKDFGEELRLAKEELARLKVASQEVADQLRAQLVTALAAAANAGTATAATIKPLALTVMPALRAGVNRVLIPMHNWRVLLDDTKDATDDLADATDRLVSKLSRVGGILGFIPGLGQIARGISIGTGIFNAATGLFAKAPATIAQKPIPFRGGDFGLRLPDPSPPSTPTSGARDLVINLIGADGTHTIRKRLNDADSFDAPINLPLALVGA